MAKTAQMKLLELMVLKQDISSVIEYIGKKENFQFQSKLKDKSSSAAADTSERRGTISPAFPGRFP